MTQEYSTTASSKLDRGPASTTAAYLAAAAGRAVGMVDVVTAVEQEYRKLGRLVLAGEFGKYLALFA